MLYPQMPRHKQYCEEEVTEKAMHLFWTHGYKATSTRMLEEATGINKFSIYACYGSKEGLFLAGLKLYIQKVEGLVSKLEAAQNGLQGIKEYFHDFLTFSKQCNIRRGCFVANTAGELDATINDMIVKEVVKFHTMLKDLFRQKLMQEQTLDADTVNQKTDTLIVALIGLSAASRLCTKKELNHYIEDIFS